MKTYHLGLFRITDRALRAFGTIVGTGLLAGTALFVTSQDVERTMRSQPMRSASSPQQPAPVNQMDALQRELQRARDRRDGAS